MRYVVAVLVAVAATGEYALVEGTEGRAALASVLGKKYKLASSEGFNDYMKEVGVSATKRAAGNQAKPTIELTENNGEYSLSSKSSFGTIVTKFKIGQQFDDKTPDGRQVKSIFTQQGNVLTEVQTGGGKTSKIVRTFTPQEVKMVLTAGDKVSTRIYKPVT